MIDDIDIIEDEIEDAPADQSPAAFGYQSLLIRQIRRDGGTQARIGLHEATVIEYTELMRDHLWDFGSRQRPIVLFDGESFWLADGFHRIEAAQRAQLSDFPVEVLRGTKRDAVLRAAGANSQHGLRRTNADKRQAVELLLKDAEWRQWSDRKIADVCAVDHKTVADVRKSLGGELPHLETRQGADGKSYPVPAPAAPKPATCVRCGKGRDLYRQLTSYDVDLVPEYPGRAVTLCSTCIPELLKARAQQALSAPHAALDQKIKDIQADGEVLLDSSDEQHRQTIEAILSGDHTPALIQQAYDHAAEIHNLKLHNAMIAKIDAATDTPIGKPAPIAPAQPESSGQSFPSKEYDQMVARDAGVLERARNFIAAGEHTAARTILSGIEVAMRERDQVLATIPSGREITLEFNADECAALLKEARMFSGSELTKRLPTIGQTLILLVEAIKGEAGHA